MASITEVYRKLEKIQKVLETSGVTSGATESTLSSLLTAFNAKDFSLETTQLAAFNEIVNIWISMQVLESWVSTGQAVTASSAPVVLSTEQEAILSGISTLLEVPDTSTNTAIALTLATSVTVLASNASRKGATFYNNSAEDVFIKFGTSASPTSFTIKLIPDDFWNIPQPVYTGIVTAYCTAGIASDLLQVSELT